MLWLIYLIELFATVGHQSKDHLNHLYSVSFFCQIVSAPTHKSYAGVIVRLREKVFNWQYMLSMCIHIFLRTQKPLVAWSKN